MKPFVSKWIGGILLMFLSLLNLQAQTDTLCNPNENKKIFGELYFNYGSIVNSYSAFNRSNVTMCQPLVSVRSMLSQSNQSAFGVYSTFLLPPQPPILLATQGDYKDRIRISWNANPLSPAATGFTIYRDGSYMTDLGEDVRQFLDFNVQAGEYYEYSIVAKNIFGSGSAAKSVGFVNPNGVVSGKIETNSNNPVPGVEVRLTQLTGASMSFDGVDDELCVSYNDKFPTNKFTVSAYVKLGDGNSETGIIDWGSSLHKNWWITTTKSPTEGKGYIFHIGNGTGSDSLKYFIPNEITNPELPNQWHQITMVYNGTALSVMVDGNFVGTKPASISRTKNYLNIGGKIGSNGFFKGKIDDVRIYNRPLTQSEVISTQNRSISKTENGLVAYWKMDEGLGEKVFDNSLVPTNANIYGGAKFSTDIPEVYNAAISDATGYYVIDGINYSNTESFRATPMKNIEYNSAVEFNAANKSYGNLTNYDIPDTATIEVLFHPFDLKSRQTVLSKGSLYELYVDNSHLFLKLNGNANDLGVIKAKYYHVAVAMDNTHNTAKIYLEGELAKTVSFTGTSNWAVGNPWLIATNSTDATMGNFYTGLIDEVAIYKTALPINEIQRHFVLGIPQDSTTNLLYSYFDLNEGSDTKVYDYANIGFGGETPREGTLTKANWSKNVRRPNSIAHEFEPNVKVVNINTSNTAIGNIDFKDVSTVNVSGYVRFANTFCFEDKVEILVNGKSAFPQIITDKNGKWSVDFEPGVSVKLSAIYKDHIFSPPFVEFRKLQSPKAGIVFLDNTVRSIKVQVAGGICKKSIIPDSSHYAVVSVKTLDGCFVRTDTIFNSDGIHLFKNLPARAFNVNVVYYGIPAAMSQFNLQGKLIDLRDTQKDSTDFIYYAPVQVEASPIASAYQCTTLGDIAVLKFLQLSTTTIKVFEEYFGVRCYSNDATIILKNGISNLPDSTNHLTNGEFVYKFRPGPINITTPYTKKLEIRAKIDNREGVLTNPIQAIVLGEKSRGGNTFTSVSSPIIVDILRDPPGDQGYAWREAGTTGCVNFSTSVSKNVGDSQGLFASVGPTFEISAGFGVTVGTETEVIATTTDTWTKSKNYSNNVTDQVCYTNNQVITTSTGDDYVGRDGDLYIGTTTNIVWGMSDLMDWDTLNCTVKITSKLSVDNKGFNSQFTYSTRYLENFLLPDLIKLSQLPATNKADSLSYLDTYRAWRKIIAEEDKRKIIGYNEVSKIYTLDAGSSIQETTTLDSTSDKTFNYSYDYNFNSESSVGLLVGGVGGSFNFGFNYNVTSEGSKTVNKSSTNTYGFFIGDDDRDDTHAIGVTYPNSVKIPQYHFADADNSAIQDAINSLNSGYNYGTNETVFNHISENHHLPTTVKGNNYKAAIFTLFAGSTSCPYEGGRPRERVNFSSDVSQLINVPANTQAVYTLSLGNESPSEETRTYLVKLVNESNPDGAIIKINGQPITATPVPFTVKYGQPQKVTMTLDKGPVKYNYDGIKIAYYSECEYDAVEAKDDSLFATKDTVGVSYNFYQELSFDTHFIEPCSSIDIGFPLQDWVIIPSSLNKLPITLTEYNKNDVNLKQVLVQYRPIGGDGSWTNITIIPKTSLTDIFTQYQWNTELFKDGAYEIRAVAECSNPSLAPGISTVMRGTLERQPPELVGVPEPGDGTWDPGDEISITFNEPINCDKVVQADKLANNTIGLYDATTNALVDARISCVGNKLIIVPNINPVFFENRTFRVVVSGKDYDDAQLLLNPNHQAAALRDKAGNAIPKTIKWEFAVNQNNLEWVGTDVIETNEVLKPFSLKRQIRNRGGSIASFRMESIPSWLTVTPATGTLNPGQVADITLTFQQDLLIGDYLDTLQMHGSKGDEPLLIDFRVRCPTPVYVVDSPSQYEGSMNMVVDLSIFGVTSTDPSDIIVAKIDGQIRGVGKVAYYRNLPADKLRWLTFMTIYGDPKDIGKPIEFHVWQGVKCNEYVEVLEQFTYQEGALEGSPLVPTQIHVINLVKKCIPLNKGFNWVSINLNLGTGRNTFKNILSSLKNKDGAYMKTDNNFAEYLGNGVWDALDSLILPTKRYMLYVTGNDTVCIKGEPYKPNLYPITIKSSPQWNWLGYVPTTGMTVTQALKGLIALNGDIIKSQTLFAQYVAGVGWIGNLNFLEPLKGYLLKIGNNGMLTYPSTGSAALLGNNGLENGISEEALAVQAAQEAPMTYDFTKYQLTMNLIGKVNGIEINPNDELRAYVDGKLVGMNKSISYSEDKLFFQTIYYQDEQILNFKLFKADKNKEYDLAQNVVFKGETIKGLVDDPFIFELASTSQKAITIAIENQVITKPATIFAGVSIPANVIEGNANCTTYGVSTILPHDTISKPSCTAQILDGNMSTVIKIKYNELSSFVADGDMILFTNSVTGVVVGCSKFNIDNNLFYALISGATTSTKVPIDVKYYSSAMKKSFTVRAGITYDYNTKLGNSLAPFILDVSPLSVSSDANGLITAVLRDTSWTGKYYVNAFAMNCNGFSNGTTTFCFQRLKVIDCVELTAGNNSAICAGNTLNLTSAQGGASYAWSGPNNFVSTDRKPSISGVSSLGTGIYSVTATHSSGCTSTATTSVTIYANQVNTAINNSPICVGTSLNLIGGGIGTTYAWTGPNNFTSSQQSPSIANADVAASGSYRLTVTNANGCTNLATTSVTVNANPIPTVSSNSPICVGNTLILTGGGTETAYAWSGPNNFTSSQQSPSIPNAIVSTSGIYTLTVTNVSGCTGSITTSVIVNANPLPTASSNSPICVGTLLMLTGGGTEAAYAWSGPNNFTSSQQSPTIANVSIASMGNYTLMVTNANGCTSTIMTSVTVNVNPIPTASSNSPICAGTALTLTGDGIGTVYAWTGANNFTSSQQNPSIANASVAATGNYTLTVTNANGCTSSVTTSVTVNANPTATASSNSPIYAKTTLNLTGAGGGTYAWAGPNLFTSSSQNPSVTNVSTADSGIYTLTVTTNGCTNLATTSVTIFPAVIIYVNKSNTNGFQDGTNWTKAFSNLQSAIATASAILDSPVEIWVAKGTYKPTANTDRSISFTPPSGVKMYGGFVGTETLLSQRNFRTNETLLSGDIGTVDLATDNSTHIMKIIDGNNQTLIDGFSIKYGYALANSSALTEDNVSADPQAPVSSESGGAIYIQNSSPTIANCIIQSNTGIFGAGIYSEVKSVTNIKFCYISGNSATFGGGIYNMNSNSVVSNTVISGNKALGGAMYNNNSSPTITNATISGNDGTVGGIFNNTPSIPIIKNSIIWNNSGATNSYSIITYSIVQGGYTGVGNMNLDPKFVSSQPYGLAPITTGNYHVLAGSPSNDMGENGKISTTDIDLDGNLRRNAGGIVDMGAYEFNGFNTGLIISIIAGNWEDASTWNLNRIPTLTDNVIININHTVTVNGMGEAKSLEYRTNGKVNFGNSNAQLKMGF